MAVTCFLPVFNAAFFLPSWWQKNGRELSAVDADLLVVDNASTDDTVREIEKFRYPKTRVICHSRNLGVEESFETARKNIESQFRIFLPADDWLAPGYLEDALRIMEADSSIGTVYGYGHMVTGTNTTRRFHPARKLGARKETPFFSLLFNNVVPDISLYRAEVLSSGPSKVGWFKPGAQFSVLAGSKIYFTGRDQCYSGKSPAQLSKAWDRSGKYTQFFLDIYGAARTYSGAVCWPNSIIEGNPKDEELILDLLRDFFVKAIEINFLTSTPFAQVYRLFLAGGGHAQSGFLLIQQKLAAAMLRALIDELFLVDQNSFLKSGRFGTVEDLSVLADWAGINEIKLDQL